MNIIRFPSTLSMDQTPLLAEGLQRCMEVSGAAQWTMDLTDLQKVSAFGLAALGARLVWLIRTGRMPSGSVIRRPQNNRVGNDLVRMGLFKLLQEASDRIYRAPDPFARPQELWLVDRAEDLKQASDQLCKLLRTALPADEEVLARVSGIMQSLGANVFRHAHSPSGAMLCGQVFPSVNVIEFAVADSGVGIPAAMARLSPELAGDDAQAIGAALTAKVAVQDGLRPGTLSTLLATARQNKGEMVVLSGRAALALKAGDLMASPNQAYGGTVVGMRLILPRENRMESR
jgi:hypothetical protein